MAKTRLNGVVTSATTAEEGLPSSSSSSSFEEQQQQQHDAFLLSMTFGNGNFNGNNNCNCSDDECNTTYANATAAAANNNVPRSIREAVIDHNNARMKKQRRTQQNGSNYSFRQHQSRELVRRECGFALYRLALPVSNNNDPIIVEYRNNHRILYIHRLDGNTNINDNNNRLYSIGEGIIGSAYEESTRKQLDWVRGTSYLLPKCTGIACGWVVRHGPGAVKDDDDDDDETMSDNKSTDVSVDNDAAADAVIMYSLKISSNDLQSMIHALPTDDTVSGGTSPSTWVVKARELFLGRLSSLNAVEEKKMNKYDDDGNDVDIAVDESSLKDCIALSENETASMKLIIELAT